jgi:hypothetical protein
MFDIWWIGTNYASNHGPQRNPRLVPLRTMQQRGIWDRNLYAIPTAQIKDMECLMTLIDGKVVYQSKEFDQTQRIR